MPQPAAPIEGVIGIDVAQASLTLHDSLTQHTWTCPNTRAGLTAALTPLHDRALAVCEATGGHETLLLEVLLTLGIPAHRADGAKISAFARSLHRAKTDRIDARTLALYGRERGATLPRWVPPTATQSQLTALVRRRTDLVAARKAERTRAKAPGAQAIADSLARTLAFLEAEIATLETAITALITASKRLTQRHAVLTSLPGVGATIAASLLALLPELGHLTRRQAAALAGVAPHPDQTGTTRNRARTTGGRRPLRPFLFCAALTATRGDNPLSRFYKRLVAAGKSKRLALSAVMRKIVIIANARLTENNMQLT